MDSIIDKETREIFRAEIEALIEKDSKYISLGPDEIQAIVNAFDFTLTNGKKNVRAQMLYDEILKIKKE
ncbi:hypothetical protein C6497_16335 [Candidatus Poribacteria bacterium]|nr:MAG: hypothetical protein C6497_16335 [Candidatus Poribacteria bacterium]